MKKSFFFFILIMSILLKSNAGYTIRGINYSSTPPDDLKNYTLTFYKDNGPISAASMHTNIAPGTGKNTIIIIFEGSIGAYIFPLMLPYEPNLPNDVEVRDFHYDWSSDEYILCGARQLGSTKHAFVATISGDFAVMRFFEYPNADIFYSLCFAYPNSPTPVFTNYYLCGSRGDYGVIASVNRSSMVLTNFYVTDEPWVYHKIIPKYGVSSFIESHFVASGRNPERTRIGFSAFDNVINQLSFRNYVWGQNTDTRSLCVVSDDPTMDNTIVLASTYQNVVTLNPVTYPLLSPMQVRAYRFALPGLTHTYHIQDIGTLKLSGNSFRISVAGFTIGPSVSQIRAWHGSLVGLSTASTIRNNYYSGPPNGRYEHYKIRYQDVGGFIKEFTGGYFQDADKMCALFGTPLTPVTCDSIYISSLYTHEPLPCGTFSIQQGYLPSFINQYRESIEIDIYAYDDCHPFKGGYHAPEFVISTPEKESEITTYYDRITIKDITAGTNYQIYTVTGQLIQTGITDTDISTAHLTKGMYILRLENGKAVKFIKK